MDFLATRLPFRQTSYFSKTVLDYLDQAESLRPFYLFQPSMNGMRRAIDARQGFATNRRVLVGELKAQYATLASHHSVYQNIESLLSDNTFTITTAHQPNIFTGPLYFIYKILHAIRMAEHCRTSMPEYNFVPVFFMGSEDADLAELGHFYLAGEKISWNTSQSGAVGRMRVDKAFLRMISDIEGQLAVLPHGKEIFMLAKSCYNEGQTIQDATFKFIDELFGEFGLIVVIPDNVNLKRQAIPIFKDELLNETASVIVAKTAARLEAAGYGVQANPREINLFYLTESHRDRIVKTKDAFITYDPQLDKPGLTFRQGEIIAELEEHPNRFSPNVILRGIFQETILPNLVYIGGGGEIAYWLQLKDLFEFYKTPYPMLLLRNSFLVVEKKWREKIGKMGFNVEDFFVPVQELMNRLVTRETKNEIKLNGNFTQAEALYESLRKQAVAVDASLGQHVDALRSQSIQRLKELEKKMLRAEKRKFSDQQRQLSSIRGKLFPGDGLQERIENLMYFYAKWGKDFLNQLYQHSLSLEQEFVVITEQ